MEEPTKKQADENPDRGITDDSVLAGILSALGCDVNPIPKANGIVFEVSNGYAAAIRSIGENGPVPARDVYLKIKSVRQSMYALKELGGNK